MLRIRAFHTTTFKRFPCQSIGICEPQNLDELRKTTRLFEIHCPRFLIPKVDSSPSDRDIEIALCHMRSRFAMMSIAKEKHDKKTKEKDHFIVAKNELLLKELVKHHAHRFEDLSYLEKRNEALLKAIQVSMVKLKSQNKLIKRLLKRYKSPPSQLSDLYGNDTRFWTSESLPLIPPFDPSSFSKKDFDFEEYRQPNNGAMI